MECAIATKISNVDEIGFHLTNHPERERERARTFIQFTDLTDTKFVYELPDSNFTNI